MICKKCNTAMDALDETCKTCGETARKLNRNWSKFAKISVISLVIAAFGAYILLYNLGLFNLDFLNDMLATGGAQLEEQIPDDNIDNAQMPNEDIATLAPIIPLRRDVQELNRVLAAIFDAVNSYMSSHSHFNPIITRMGYLYNATNGSLITIERLVDLGYLNSDYLGENVHILFLRPGDFSQFDEVELYGLLPMDASLLTVFLAYDNVEGFGLFSRHGEHIIFRENLNRLLAGYNPDFNGAIQRPGSGHPIYAAVMNVIESDISEPAFIRYLAVDDAHGFVAFTIGQGQDITNYVFDINHGSDGGGIDITVRAAGFEVTQHPKVAINGAIVNFNFELMPNYDITNISLEPLHENSELIHALVYEEHLPYGHLPDFISLARGFSFIVYNGISYLAQYNDGWSIVEINGWQAAEELLGGNVNNPPLYIIWQH